LPASGLHSGSNAGLIHFSVQLFDPCGNPIAYKDLAL
jgi:hypothetical protein